MAAAQRPDASAASDALGVEAVEEEPRPTVAAIHQVQRVLDAWDSPESCRKDRGFDTICLSSAGSCGNFNA